MVKNKRVIASKEAISGIRDGVSNLIKIADKYSAKVSFAVMPEVVEYFPKNINHEIGLHIHPGWERYKLEDTKFIVGDKYLRENSKQSSDSTFLWDYPYEEQFNMIKIGKERLTEKFGKAPKFFVAGRWCVNDDTIAALVANGITHDCSAPAHSISDHYDWSKLSRICMPYHPDKTDYQKEGSLPILIVPISQYFPIGNVNPEIVPAMGVSWLKACFLEYYRQKAPVFHICLHSPSMADNYFISAMDNLLSFISKYKDVHFKFVSEIKECRERDIRSDIWPYLGAININLIKKYFRKVFIIKDEEFSKQNSV